MPLKNWGDDFDVDEPTPIQEQMGKIGKIGGTHTLERNGVEFFSKIGKGGGETTKEKYGADHYQRIGRLSAAAKAKHKEELALAKLAFEASLRARDENTSTTGRTAQGNRRRRPRNQ